MAEEPLLDEQGILEVGPGRTFFWAISMDEKIEAEERNDPEHVVVLVTDLVQGWFKKVRIAHIRSKLRAECSWAPSAHELAAALTVALRTEEGLQLRLPTAGAQDIQACAVVSIKDPALGGLVACRLPPSGSLDQLDAPRTAHMGMRMLEASVHNRALEREALALKHQELERASSDLHAAHARIEHLHSRLDTLHAKYSIPLGAGDKRTGSGGALSRTPSKRAATGNGILSGHPPSAEVAGMSPLGRASSSSTHTQNGSQQVVCGQVRLSPAARRMLSLPPSAPKEAHVAQLPVKQEQGAQGQIQAQPLQALIPIPEAATPACNTGMVIPPTELGALPVAKPEVQEAQSQVPGVGLLPLVDVNDVLPPGHANEVQHIESPAAAGAAASAVMLPGKVQDVQGVMAQALSQEARGLPQSVGHVTAEYVHTSASELHAQVQLPAQLPAPRRGISSTAKDAPSVKRGLVSQLLAELAQEGAHGHFYKQEGQGPGQGQQPQQQVQGQGHSPSPSLLLMQPVEVAQPVPSGGMTQAMHTTHILSHLPYCQPMLSQQPPVLSRQTPVLVQQPSELSQQQQQQQQHMGMAPGSPVSSLVRMGAFSRTARVVQARGRGRGRGR